METALSDHALECELPFKIKTVQTGRRGDQEGLELLREDRLRTANNINSPRSVGDVITETENNAFRPCINTTHPKPQRIIPNWVLILEIQPTTWALTLCPSALAGVTAFLQLG